MILPDHDIAIRCRRDRTEPPLIEPFQEKYLQPASVDLTLDDLFVLYPPGGPVDLADVARTLGEPEKIQTSGYYLRSQGFVLGSTSERINIPSDLVGIINGKSSIARMGVCVHLTAGFIDPGFRGKITLEIVNYSDRAIILRPGLRICQIVFPMLTDPARKLYGHTDLGSRYQDQIETTASRYTG